MKFIKKLCVFSIVAIFIITASRGYAGAKTCIMSFNLRREGRESDQKYLWENRVPLIKPMLLQTQPDIVGFQEAGPNQIMDIYNILGNNYAWVGRGRQQKGIVGWFCSVDEHTPIFYNKTRFKLLEHDTFWLNPTKTPKKTGWGARLNRICTWAKFMDLQSQAIMWIFNIHLDNKSWPARTEGLKLTIKEIQNLTKNNEPSFLLGDFNGALHEGPLADIIADDQYKMVNTKTIAHEVNGPHGTAFQHGWKGQTKSIDHILMNCSNSCTIAQHTVWVHPDNKRVSDHNPVFIVANTN